MIQHSANDAGGRAPCGCGFRTTGQVAVLCPTAHALYPPPAQQAYHGSPALRAYSAHLNTARRAIRTAQGG